MQTGSSTRVLSAVLWSSSLHTFANLNRIRACHTKTQRRAKRGKRHTPESIIWKIETYIETSRALKKAIQAEIVAIKESTPCKRWYCGFESRPYLQLICLDGEISSRARSRALYLRMCHCNSDSRHQLCPCGEIADTLRLERSDFGHAGAIPARGTNQWSMKANGIAAKL
jgi:hypothetical protein